MFQHLPTVSGTLCVPAKQGRNKIDATAAAIRFVPQRLTDEVSSTGFWNRSTYSSVIWLVRDSGRASMDANTIAAVGATATAAISLIVSVRQGRAMIEHNRQSVRPLLQLKLSVAVGRDAGIRLINCGLGPAVIRESRFLVDGHVLGAWDERTVDGFRRSFSPRPQSYSTFHAGYAIPVGYKEFIISVENYDPNLSIGFWRTISTRVGLEIDYESIYGERFIAVLPSLTPESLTGSPGHRDAVNEPSLPPPN